MNELQIYLDQAFFESKSETKASGVRQRAELQKLIKAAGLMRKTILLKHKKPVVEPVEEVKEPEPVAVEEPEAVEEVVVEKKAPKAKTPKKAKK
jgi:hypothetical protein